MCVERFWLCSQILDNFFSAAVRVSSIFLFKLLSESVARAWLIAVGLISNKFHILVDLLNALLTAGLEDLCSNFLEWALMFFGDRFA